MNDGQGRGPQLFRIWIADCSDWRPSGWNDVPPRAVALEPAEEGCLRADEAREFLAAFNAQMLSSPRQIWAVALPVSIRFEGDPTPGQQVSGHRFAREPAGFNMRVAI